MTCSHKIYILPVSPGTKGCAECLVSGSPWVHLRLCRTCGHVGCCDQSPNRHARGHFSQTLHPIIESYEPEDDWGWCYPDAIFIHLPKTPRAEGIPSFVPTTKENSSV